MNQSISRVVLGVVLLALTLSFPADAQQAKAPRIGFLFGASPSANAGRIEAFRKGLHELGYIEAKNIVIEVRYAEGKLDRLPVLAAELARRAQDGFGVKLGELVVEARDGGGVGMRIGDGEDGVANGCGVRRFGVPDGFDAASLNLNDGDIDAIERGPAHDAGYAHILM